MEQTVVDAGMLVVGAILEMSAARLAGASHQGRAGGDNVRHGRQAGAIYLGGRKHRTTRPRVRNKAGCEVKIPAYETLKDKGKAADKVLAAAIAGVSTRNYARAVEDSAGAVGLSKSNVSRKLVEKTTAELKTLAERPVPKDLLAVMIDGIRMGEHLLIGAVGIDSSGKKHVLGLAAGATENALVVGDLLSSIKELGLDTSQKLLFVIDGSKALKAAIVKVCGEHHEIQRCREHKIRNVTDRVSKIRVKYIRAYMRAAWKLGQSEGIAKMRRLAQELEVSYPDAARSVLEGLEDSFTVNRLGLPPLLVSSLDSTNIIESSNGTIRSITGRLKNVLSADQALRWASTALLEAEIGFRVLRGHKQLWMLAAALGRTAKEEAV
jgi:putative transposase